MTCKKLQLFVILLTPNAKSTGISQVVFIPPVNVTTKKFLSVPVPRRLLGGTHFSSRCLEGKTA